MRRLTSGRHVPYWPVEALNTKPLAAAALPTVTTGAKPIDTSNHHVEPL